MKKLTACPDGGFVSLQLRLAGGQEIDCHACLALLKSCNCDFDALAAAIAGATSISSELLPIEDAPRSDQSKADGDDEQDEDPLAYAKSFPGIIEVLPPGTFGKALPYRCLICKSKTQPEGRVGNLNVLNKKAIMHFLDQHIQSCTHQKNLKDLERAKHGEPVPCEALLLEDESAGSLFEAQSEFRLWAAHANLKTFARHTYWQEQGVWHIRSSACLQTCMAQPGSRPMCPNCSDLGKTKGVVRTVLKFAHKFFLANLLSARLFQDPERSKEVESEIRSSLLYRRGPVGMEKTLKLSNGRLQQLLRATWLKGGSEVNATEAQSAFVSSVVQPALRFNIATVPECFSDVVTRFSASIASGLFDDRDVAKLKIAAGVLDGRLDNHPLLHGLSLQCMRLLEKQQRGVNTMRGRRSTENPLETALISDAGLRLAMMSNNKKLAKELL